MSVIFRSVYESRIVERFMGFFDINKDRKACDMFDLLTTSFNHLDLTSKLIGQSYDGAAVMAGELNGAQNKIKDIATQAMFTHCYAHKMNLVLQDAPKQIKECRIFFFQKSRLFLYFFQNRQKKRNFYITYIIYIIHK